MSRNIEVNDIDFQLLEDGMFDLYSAFRKNKDRLDSDINHIVWLVRMFYKKLNYKEEESFSIFVEHQNTYAEQCYTEGFSHEFMDYTWLASTRNYYNKLFVESNKSDSDFLKMPVDWQLEVASCLDDQELNKVKEWLKLTGTNVMREW